MVAHYGADSTPCIRFSSTLPTVSWIWQDEGVEGIERFLSRVYRFAVRHVRPDDADWNQSVPEI